MIERPKTKSIQNTIYTGTWSEKKIPVYTVLSANALNQLVGYVKHINAPNGTVLYRGQCELHPSVIPSICRDPSKVTDKETALNSLLAKMSNDKSILSFWNLDSQDIAGWDLYQRLAIEATLQHYGAETFCVDFVDNHWTALWFGLYKWDEKHASFDKRKADKKVDEDKLIDWDVLIDSALTYPPRPLPSLETELDKKTLDEFAELAKRSNKSVSEFISSRLSRMNTEKERKWKNQCKRVDERNKIIQSKWNTFNADNDKAHMYLFMYVAETNCPTLNGVSFGENTYTVDLRKALPSTFLRPCAQHGWIVKGKQKYFCYEENIACVIRINISLVDELLGKGTLVSENNFFPPAEFDQGYRVLLQRQEGTPYSEIKKFPKLLPPNTIKF